MHLAWMRGSGTALPDLSETDWHKVVTQSEALGFRQVHLSGQKVDILERLPPLQRLRVGIDVSGFAPQAPRALTDAIRHAYDRLEGRLVLGITTGASVQARTTLQMSETILSDTPISARHCDFPMAPPRPEVLTLPQMGTAPGVARAAANGFHVLSPAWQSRQDVSRHWPAYVAGATHAARRACPSQWHVARCVYVSEDPSAVVAYRRGVARAYLRQAAPSPALADALIIAGSAAHVAEHLAGLRQRIGPFGTLHCIDPGLDPAEGHQQRARLARQMLPLLTCGTTATPEKKLERI